MSPEILKDNNTNEFHDTNPSKMVIRRSIIGSLKGNPSTSLHRAETLKSSIMHQPLPPDALRLKQHDFHNPLPKLNQSVDLVCVGDLSIDKAQIFEECLPTDPTINREHRLFGLPADIRREIYSYCFPYESRKVILSPTFAIAGVYPDNYFASAWDILIQVWGGLESFRALRNDLMTYFWTNYRFHAILTPFNGPIFCPLSHVWLRDYLQIVQNLTVEVDFTKLGGSSLKLAPAYGYIMKPTEVMLIDIVCGLIKRKATTTMAELHVMCRRYAGFRPHEKTEKGEKEVTDTVEEVPWCPENVTMLCDAVCDMRGILQKCRISGFTQDYTEMLLVALYGQGKIAPDWVTATEPAWPPTPAPPAFIKTTSLILMAPEISAIPEIPITPSTPATLVVPSISSSASQSSLKLSDFSLKLTRSRSFREDFEEQMIKFKLYADYTSDTVMEDNSNEFLVVGDEETTGNNQNYETNSLRTHNLRDHNDCSGPRRSSITGVTPLPCRLQPLELSSPVHTPSQFARPPQIRCSTPNSPDAMNQMNEQDPAFLRTLKALRQLDETPKTRPGARPLSMQLGPRPVLTEFDRTLSSPINRSISSKKRYFIFVNKLRSGTD